MLLLPPAVQEERPPSRGVPVFIVAVWVLYTAAAAGLTIFSNGSLVLALLPPVGLAAVTVIYHRLDLGLLAALFGVLLADQVPIHFLPASFTSASYFPYMENMKNIQGLGALGFLKPSLFELHLGFLILVWVLRGLAGGKVQTVPLSNRLPFLLFFLVLGVFFVYGMARGGDLKAALWELRALGYLATLYMFLPQVLHTRRHIHWAFWVIAVSVTIKAWQGLYRYFIVLHMVYEYGGHEIGTVTNHEDALFFVTLLMMFFLLLLFRTGTRGLRWFLGLNLVPILVCLVVTQRRVAYGAVAFALLLSWFMVPAHRKRVLAKPLIALAIAWCVYYPIFKNSNAKIGMLAVQMKSVFGGPENDDSALWREIEEANLKATLRIRPLGLGFGQKFYVFYPQPPVLFPLWQYIPHNNLMWIWVKTGWEGFMVFWFMICMSIVRAVQFARYTRNPFFQVVAILAALQVCCQVFVSYYELQMGAYRNTILLGSMLGLVEVARQIERRTAASTLLVEGKRP